MAELAQPVTRDAYVLERQRGYLFGGEHLVVVRQVEEPSVVGREPAEFPATSGTEPGSTRTSSRKSPRFQGIDTSHHPLVCARHDGRV